MPFPLPKGKPEFSKLEEAILAKWKAEKTFEKSVESRPAENPYRFYDGPPFITGTPHYGSLLSSIIKDVVPRYQTMLGKRVERVWGWDCHGLPIEQKVQKKLGLESNKEIEESEGGIQHFIDECYNYTRETSADWNWYIDHIGRWVDMDHAYRTMDQNYMESVMWVFKQIWEKGYVYEGKRVSWYSWKLSTPISNFEIAMDDSYQDVQDPAVTIKFPVNDVRKGAGLVILDEAGKLLMIKNKKDGLWRFPGGNIEPGESYHAGAARELLEETGITCELTPYCSTYLGYRGLFYEALSFRGTVPVGQKVELEKDKFSDYEYFSLDALPVMSEIHRMEHDLIDFLTGVREPVIVPEISTARTVNILAWTTTPWTLPMHMALAVNKDLEYVAVYHAEEIYILAASRVETVFKGKGDYQILCKISGEEFIGLHYTAPFDFYQGKIPADKNFIVYHADFVTDTDGTGIAHEAPEFGDVDFGLAKEKGIHITAAIDEAGKYTAEVPDYTGTLYLEAIEPICERLKTEGTLFKKESITHRVPYCPRSNTPLIQKAQKSWFIDIQRIKKELIGQNESINWFPDHFKHGRFLKSLESAPDWCVSRSRFWGTPMPVWENSDGSERVVIDSREELYQRNKPLGQITKTEDGKYIDSNTGEEINLHRPYIDRIYLPGTGKKPKKVLAIHGYNRTGKVVDFFGEMKIALEEEKVKVDAPFFQDGNEVDYDVWKPVLDKHFTKDVDTVITHSLGGKIARQYIIDNNIHLKRLVLVATRHDMSDRPELQRIEKEQFTHTFTELRGCADEIIVVYGEGDRVPESSAREVAELAGAKLVVVGGGVGHFNVSRSQVIEQIVLHGAPLRRIPEVLDVWMDSASMPYAQVHYPFENVEKMEASFPADFIAEYTGQIRAWFYVMHVIGVLVKGSPAFKNVAVTGVINGTDGRKMSKSFGNYPDPRETIEKYGADAIRFYLMSGPIMKGEDMNFSEQGIQDSLKKVLLPLWNAYTFFATYANIDNWEPDGTEISLIRHGQTKNNVERRINGGGNDLPLNAAGQGQADTLGRELAAKGFSPDVIIASSLSRAQETAKRVFPDAEIEVMPELKEQDYGEFDGRVIDDVMKEYKMTDIKELQKLYRNNSTENVADFRKRTLDIYSKILQKYRGKKIVIVGHGGTGRVLRENLFGLSYEEAWLNKMMENGDVLHLPLTPKAHELDTWIISQLHELIAEVKKNMDTYDTQKTCDLIVSFLERLNNWYIRRNRRRFWRKEVDADKCSAYETLHEVLVTVCQLLAPICPFLTEHLYQNLKKDASSVHLTYFPEPNPVLIGLEVNQKMEDLQNLTNLGMAIRGREKLRVRQPLRSASITIDLDESARAVLAEELNVKEIHTIKNISDYVTVTYSPDAKKIGATDRKQFMKTIIADAKAGRGVLTPEGTLEIALDDAPDGKIVLASDEFETIYTPKEGSTIAFAGFAGYIIGLDTTLDEELTLEGYSRDLIRGIQDARKELGFEVTDRLQLSVVSGNSLLEQILATHQAMIEKETLTQLKTAKTKGDASKEVELDEGFTVSLTLQK